MACIIVANSALSRLFEQSLNYKNRQNLEKWAKKPIFAA
jgi:hypothetical protein